MDAGDTRGIHMGHLSLRTRGSGAGNGVVVLNSQGGELPANPASS